MYDMAIIGQPPQGLQSQSFGVSDRRTSSSNIFPAAGYTDQEMRVLRSCHNAIFDLLSFCNSPSDQCRNCPAPRYRALMGNQVVWRYLDYGHQEQLVIQEEVRRLMERTRSVVESYWRVDSKNELISKQETDCDIKCCYCGYVGCVCSLLSPNIGACILMTPVAYALARCCGLLKGDKEEQNILEIRKLLSDIHSSIDLYNV